MASQGFGDVTKLRELAAQWERKASRLRHKAAKYLTKMERARHSATVYKQKHDGLQKKIPELEAQIADLEKELRAGANPSSPLSPAEQSRIQLKIRKIQEKIMGVHHRAHVMDQKAAHQMAVASKHKITADMFQEQAKAAEAEAESYTARADRLQKASEGDLPPASPRPPPASSNP
jgi:chromosome segregation ATPase